MNPEVSVNVQGTETGKPAPFGRSNSRWDMQKALKIRDQNRGKGLRYADEKKRELEENPNSGKKLVEIGFNLLMIDDINDQQNTFNANFLLHIKFPVSFEPRKPYKKELWRPWIQFKNAIHLEELHNRGARRLDVSELRRMVENGTLKIGDGVRDTVNYVGTFATELDHRKFPLDTQTLQIIMTSNSEKDIVMTALKSGAIKANFEMDVLSEWHIMREGDKIDNFGNLISPAVSYFDLEPSAESLSAGGTRYWTLFFYIVVIRKYGAVMNGIIIPTALLGLSTLFIFALDIMEENGDRFALIFTAILTIFANQFSAKERLPQLSNLTLVDQFMLSMQICCYFVALESGLAIPVADALDVDIYLVDRVGFGICCSMFAIVFFGFYARYLYLLKDRRDVEVAQRKKSSECHGKEEPQ